MTNMELPKKFLNVVTVSITTIADVRNVNFENGSCTYCLFKVSY